MLYPSFCFRYSKRRQTCNSKLLIFRSITVDHFEVPFQNKARDTGIKCRLVATIRQMPTGITQRIRRTKYKRMQPRCPLISCMLSREAPHQSSTSYAYSFSSLKRSLMHFIFCSDYSELYAQFHLTLQLRIK